MLLSPDTVADGSLIAPSPAGVLDFIILFITDVWYTGLKKSRFVEFKGLWNCHCVKVWIKRLRAAVMFGLQALLVLMVCVLHPVKAISTSVPVFVPMQWHLVWSEHAQDCPEEGSYTPKSVISGPKWIHTRFIFRWSEFYMKDRRVGPLLLCLFIRAIGEDLTSDQVSPWIPPCTNFLTSPTGRPWERPTADGDTISNLVWNASSASKRSWVTCLGNGKPRISCLSSCH